MRWKCNEFKFDDGKVSQLNFKFPAIFLNFSRLVTYDKVKFLITNSATWSWFNWTKCARSVSFLLLAHQYPSSFENKFRTTSCWSEHLKGSLDLKLAPKLFELTNYGILKCKNSSKWIWYIWHCWSTPLHNGQPRRRPSSHQVTLPRVLVEFTCSSDSHRKLFPNFECLLLV